MNQKKLKRVLQLSAERLNENNIGWSLIGSFNLFLQGISTDVQDIDILLFFKDYKKVKKIFSDFNIKDEKKLSNGDGVEVRYLINNVEVQFCFEYNNGFYIKRLGKELNRNNLVHLELNSAKINCFRLQDELAGYKYLGREEKVKIISNFLQNANSK